LEAALALGFSKGLYSISSEQQGRKHLSMRSVLLLASLAVAACAHLPVEEVQVYIADKCDGLPVTKEGVCVREQLDDQDPNWQQKGGADIFEATLTAYDRIGAAVLSGALAEQQGEERMANIKAALAKAAKRMGGARRQAIAQALTNSGIPAQ
jgi:hypothetical protein